MDPTGHKVKFYRGDPKHDEILQAWEMFMNLCPEEAQSMIQSDINYVIASSTQLRGGFMPSHTLGGEKDSRVFPDQIIVIGPGSISKGIKNIVITLVHEVLGHIESDMPGNSLLEEYIAWCIEANMADRLGINITIPGGSLNSFREWVEGLPSDHQYVKEGLPLLSLTKTQIDEILTKIYDQIERNGGIKEQLDEEYGARYTYSSTTDPMDFYYQREYEFDYLYWGCG